MKRDDGFSKGDLLEPSSTSVDEGETLFDDPIMI